MTGAWIVAIFVAALAVVILLLLHRTPAGDFLHRHIPDTPRRRILLAAIAFFVTFAGVRALTWSIHNHVGPFHDIHMGGRHIHHLVFGILLLLLVGYGWLVDAGGEAQGWRLAARRLLCVLYGSGAALTLDEFALWLNLKDVYWAREGRSSLDAAILFAAFLIIGVEG
ncbi:MAG: hypothetical protein JOZ36_09900, partial [Acidobacteria bacterium]|nr:hypothetical protein [Acidobacteriota bacterium]